MFKYEPLKDVKRSVIVDTDIGPDVDDVGALVVLFKVFATTATNGGGGCGGIFAPSLFLGCVTGFVFSHFLNGMGISVYLPENNFALFGMAGLMSGVMHAPLTGIFLIAELTGGYSYVNVGNACCALVCSANLKFLCRTGHYRYYHDILGVDTHLLCIVGLYNRTCHLLR